MAAIQPNLLLDTKVRSLPIILILVALRGSLCFIIKIVPLNQDFAAEQRKHSAAGDGSGPL